MDTTSDLKNAVNTKTANFVILSIVTAVVFPLMWLYRHTKTIESITRSKIADEMFLSGMAVAGALYLPFLVVGVNNFLIGEGMTAAFVIGFLLDIAYFVPMLIWAFKAKTALETYARTAHNIDMRMNSV